MEEIEEKVNEELTRLQTELDGTGHRIKFIEEAPEGTTESLLRIVKYACFSDMKEGSYYGYKNAPSTTKLYRKGRRKQTIGYSRSLEDLYLLCKYYFPETSIFEVRDALRELKRLGIYATWFCPQHKKVMFCSSKTGRYSYSNDFVAYKYGIK